MGMLDNFKSKGEKPAKPWENACTMCGSRLSSSGMYLVDGKKVCENCYKKQKPGDFCHNCGRGGHLYAWDGHKYCNICYMSLTKSEQCGLCKQKLTSSEKRNLLPVLGRRFCDSCLAQIKEHKAESDPIKALSIKPRRKVMAPVRIPAEPSFRPLQAPIDKAPQALIDLHGQSINLRMEGLRESLARTRMVRVWRDIPLSEKEPTICLEEGGQRKRSYVLGTLPGENFTGLVFKFCLQAYYQGDPKVMVIQIGGQVCSPQDQPLGVLPNGISRPIPYRLEIYFPHSEEAAAKRYEFLRGAYLDMKALKYPGYITPGDVRLVGVCQGCGSSMTFNSFNFPMMDCVPVYDEPGHDVFALPVEEPIDNPAAWSETMDGHTFRLSNSFCCPECGEPYIRYTADSQRQVQERFGHLGCVLLGHKIFRRKPERNDSTEN